MVSLPVEPVDGVVSIITFQNEFSCVALSAAPALIDIIAIATAKSCTRAVNICADSDCVVIFVAIDIDFCSRAESYCIFTLAAVEQRCRYPRSQRRL